MLICNFEDGGKAKLRHLVTHAIIERDGKILLAKRAVPLLESGKWCLPGGFVNRDETASQAILREVLEETGWQGEVINLFRINSNPNRPAEDRQNIPLEFLIRPIKQVGQPDKESTEIKWWLIEDLYSLDFAFDHKETIELYLKYRLQPFALPLLV